MLFLKELKINMSQITLHVEKQYVEKTIDFVHMKLF